MKTIFFALSVLISLSTQAVPLPANSCQYLPADCTPWMQQVLEDFPQGRELQASDAPAVFAGECHYYSTMYGADHTHFVGLYLERDAAEGVYFNASFSFFAEENEYLRWTLADARAQYPAPFNFPLLDVGGHSMADYWPEGLWKHWLSFNPRTQEVLIVGYWGHSTQAFCRLRPSNRQN